MIGNGITLEDSKILLLLLLKRNDYSNYLAYGWFQPMVGKANEEK